MAQSTYQYHTIHINQLIFLICCYNLLSKFWVNWSRFFFDVEKFDFDGWPGFRFRLSLNGRFLMRDRYWILSVFVIERNQGGCGKWKFGELLIVRFWVWISSAVNSSIVPIWMLNYIPTTKNSVNCRCPISAVLYHGRSANNLFYGYALHSVSHTNIQLNFFLQSLLIIPLLLWYLKGWLDHVVSAWWF